MKAEKVIIKYPSLKKDDNVMLDVVVFTDGGILSIQSKKPFESISIHNYMFDSISREWITFIGYIQRRDLSFEQVKIFINQKPSE